jgi:hypothetical protein
MLDRFNKKQILPLVNHDGSYVNPLPLWRENAPRFPLLSELAHVYLAIPATSAPSDEFGVGHQEYLCANVP